jgi:hypothetical protein
MDEIINKVATSKLEVFDLEDHYRRVSDLKWIFHNGYWKAFIKGKEFRDLKNHDWTQYQGQFVAVKQHRCYCPGVASILVTIQLALSLLR